MKIEEKDEHYTAVFKINGFMEEFIIDITVHLLRLILYLVTVPSNAISISKTLMNCNNLHVNLKETPFP